jgi:hypothetical protein
MLAVKKRTSQKSFLSEIFQIILTTDQLVKIIVALYFVILHKTNRPVILPMLLFTKYRLNGNFELYVQQYNTKIVSPKIPVLRKFQQHKETPKNLFYRINLTSLDFTRFHSISLDLTRSIKIIFIEFLEFPNTVNYGFACVIRENQNYFCNLPIFPIIRV